MALPCRMPRRPFERSPATWRRLLADEGAAQLIEQPASRARGPPWRHPALRWRPRQRGTRLLLGHGVCHGRGALGDRVKPLVGDDPAATPKRPGCWWSGGIVALPTDTVYGIGVALDAPRGIDRLFEAQRRPADRAIMLLLDSAEQARAAGARPPMQRLAAAFWPGGLTVVVDQPPDAGLRRSQRPASPRSGSDARPRLPAGARRGRRPAAGHRQPLRLATSSGDAREIADQLGGDAVDCIVDGGPAHGGPASTVVDCTVGVLGPYPSSWSDLRGGRRLPDRRAVSRGRLTGSGLARDPRP